MKIISSYLRTTRLFDIGGGGLAGCLTRAVGNPGTLQVGVTSSDQANGFSEPVNCSREYSTFIGADQSSSNYVKLKFTAGITGGIALTAAAIGTAAHCSSLSRRSHLTNRDLVGCCIGKKLIMTHKYRNTMDSLRPWLSQYDGPSGFFEAKKSAGEDAFFAKDMGSHVFFGVADGVGGWNSRGVDPSAFSWYFVENMVELCSLRLNPREVVVKAYSRVVNNHPEGMLGSSTVIVACVDRENRKLHYYNIGDSGLLVIRDKSVVHQSKALIHAFNTPYQLGIIPEDLRNSSACVNAEQGHYETFELRDGDVIVMGSDGLLDNLFPNGIASFFSNLNSKDDINSDIESATRSLVQTAATISTSNSARTPFYGDRGGGKIDDISVVTYHFKTLTNSDVD